MKKFFQYCRSIPVLLILSCTSNIEMPPPPSDCPSGGECPYDSSSSNFVLSSSSVLPSSSSSGTSGTSSSNGAGGNSSSSSTSFEASNSSSSSSEPQDNVYCRVGAACSLISKAACSALQGTIVSSCETGSSSSQVQTTTGCAESNPKAGFTCGWNITGTLVPGQQLKPVSSGNSDGCTIAWKYVDSNSPMAIEYGCMETTEDGFIAQGSKEYLLFAELTCADGKHTTACNPKSGLSSKKAPYLAGTCTWGKYDNQPTTTARGAVPSGVTLVDEDRVCNATMPPVVYRYTNGTKNWPTGIIEAGTYTDVQATVNCLTYDVPPLMCPPLEVKAGADHVIECVGDFTFRANCTADGIAGSNEVTLLLDECVEMNILGYTNQHNLPNLIMRCDIFNNTVSPSYTLILNGVAQTPASYINEIPLGRLNLGDNEFGMLCLTAISGASGVKCSGPGY